MDFTRMGELIAAEAVYRAVFAAAMSGACIPSREEFARLRFFPGFNHRRISEIPDAPEPQRIRTSARKPRTIANSDG